MSELPPSPGQEPGEIRIDGAQGEGGGQVLRTAIAAAMCLRLPVRIYNIRARRPKPGLRRQHLLAIEAAAQLSGANARGLEPGSREVWFSPSRVYGGTYAFDIGSAGSTTLVLQTLLPALLTAGTRTSISVRGGTHNPLAPPFEFFDLAYLPLLRRMGARVKAQLLRHGFAPSGGGAIRLDVDPVVHLQPLHLSARSTTARIEARIKLANLPRHIAEREKQVLLTQLAIDPDRVLVEEVDATGPGNTVLVCVHSGASTEVFSACGRRGLPAEAVARLAATEARHYLESTAAVGPHLADQLLLPLALAGAGSFTTVRPTSHTTTQARLISGLFSLPIELRPLAGERWRVTLGADTGAAGLVD